MNKIRTHMWIIGYLLLVISGLVYIAYWVVKVDPFFHYHKPDTAHYYYSLYNERNQNDGIIRQFDYDAMITGTSMVENVKTSEMDQIFGTHSIKVPYSGGSYKEINDNVRKALENNSDLQIVIRGFDMNYLIWDKDIMREDLGVYPTYLYDNYMYNDLAYVFNRDVIFNTVFPMVVTQPEEDDFVAGITSFDEYSNWMNLDSPKFGVKAVCPKGIDAPKSVEPVHLSESEKEILLGNIRQNVTSLSSEYPNVTFYYFIAPYSIAWWRDLVDNGSIYRQVEAEQIFIEEVLKCNNVKLYSFNNMSDITTDLNNYKDTIHYASWVNSLILRYMKEGKCLLTSENYRDYLDAELSFYTSYDYTQLNEQVDYEDDYNQEEIFRAQHGW